MMETPDQIKTQEQLDFCQAIESTIYVCSVKDIQNTIAQGRITGGSIEDGFITVDEKVYSLQDHVFLTLE